MKAVQDRGNPRYLNDPDRVWAGGQWRTLAGAERYRDAQHRYARSPLGKATKAALNAASNPRRIRVGELYLGLAGFTVTEREELVRGASERP